MEGNEVAGSRRRERNLEEDREGGEMKGDRGMEREKEKYKVRCKKKKR